jgi:hypothetical protein
MATLTVQEVTRLGVATTYAAAAGGGDSFAPSESTFIEVRNGGGGSINVTIAAPKQVLPDLEVTDPVVAVGAGVNKMIGPFPASQFAQSDDGLADITYSGVTSVTVAAIRLKQP